MTFPRYEQYKDSGVEWLGEVPAHWEITRLKFVSDVQTGIAKGKDNTGKATVEVPYLRVANVQDGYLDLTDVATIEIPADDLPRYRLRAGDVLMNEGGDFDKLGRGHVWDGRIDPCIHQNHVFAVRPFGVSSDWLNRITGSGYAQFYFMSRSKQSTNLASISSTNVMELPVVLPPPSEQQGIAAFLTHETAKIDALIAEQQRLIELLKEKRQAVISQAVTKGLDPGVPMKDSGVAWLGEVPAHWEVLKASLIGKLFGSEQIEESMVCEEGNLPFVKVSSLANEGFLIGSWDWYVDPNIEHRYTAKSSFVVFPKRGAAIFLNKVNVVDRPSLIDPNLMGWEIGEKAEPLYIAYCLKIRRLEELADVSTVPQINNKHIYPERFPLPPVAEQKAITLFLTSMCQQLEELTAQAKHTVQLLTERRTALISAAVTGKIDVRAFAPEFST